MHGPCSVCTHECDPDQDRALAARGTPRSRPATSSRRSPGSDHIEKEKRIMQHRVLYVTQRDMTQLRSLLESAASSRSKDREHLAQLEEELGRAEIIGSADIPRDVVTMHSRVRVKDVHSGRSMVVTVVFPSEADADRGFISVLAPIGTALLGYSAGDTVEWTTPGGPRTFVIEEVIYQPEAAGAER
jgi:regulator of nucleoside diphosphate kinase